MISQTAQTTKLNLKGEKKDDVGGRIYRLIKTDTKAFQSITMDGPYLNLNPNRNISATGNLSPRWIFHN